MSMRDFILSVFSRQIICVFFMCLCHASFALNKPVELVTESIIDGLNKPWGMAFLPNDQALISEKVGNLVLVDLRNRKKISTITGIPTINEIGQGGLLDVAIDPNFHKNAWVYLSYAKENDGLYGTEVGRGKLVNNTLEQFETLFIAQPKKSGPHHFGSRLVFDGPNYLYITLGDRGDRHEAQNVASHIGGIVRIAVDSKKEQSPYIHNKDALPELYSYGNRNVQGAALHPITKELWAHEHGPQGGDEINIIRSGKNYGWPIITYGKEYGFGRDIGEGTHKEGIEQPVWQWTPSIAPSGMAFYNSDLIPQWKGNILVGALKYQMLVRLTIDGNKVSEAERLYERKFGRIRDVKVDQQGFVYLLTDSSNGQLIRIGPGTSLTTKSQ